VAARSPVGLTLDDGVEQRRQRLDGLGVVGSGIKI
jgi:hypothetical protein